MENRRLRLQVTFPRIQKRRPITCALVYFMQISFSANVGTRSLSFAPGAVAAAAEISQDYKTSALIVAASVGLADEARRCGLDFASQTSANRRRCAVCRLRARTSRNYSTAAQCSHDAAFHQTDCLHTTPLLPRVYRNCYISHSAG